MNAQRQMSWARRLGSTLPILGILIAILTAFPTESRADSRHRNHGHAYGHSKKHHSKGYYAVPKRIHVDDRATYRSYYSGRRYYGPHRHFHASYHFPVVVNGAVVVRPYSYCGDHIFFAAPVAPLPRLAFSLSFGAPVAYYEPGFAAGGSFVYIHHDD